MTGSAERGASLTFAGEVWTWRGPSPFYFVTVPDAYTEALRSAAALVSYGWGMIPARARIGATVWRTALFPKQGAYLVPLKASVRKAEGLAEGDIVEVQLDVGP